MTNEGEADRRTRFRRRQTVGRTGARFPRLPDDEPEVPADPFPESVPQDGGAPEEDDGLVGRTGARFGTRVRRARREAEQQAAQDAVVHTQAAPVPCPRTQERPADPPVDQSPTAPLSLTELRARADGIDHRVSVRPYVRTRGRTRARMDLRVETLVSLPSPRPPLDDPEHRAIGELCVDPRSVAEVAALLRVPLGVARVLIGDMAEEGELTVHATAAGSSGPGPDREVMARVLRGLHRL